MKALCSVLMMCLTFAGAAHAGPSAWRVEGNTTAPPYRLVFDYPEQPVEYIFTCAPDHITITETGVTSLLDLATGQKVSDDSAGVAFPESSAVMALVTDPKADPNMVRGRATPSATKGWDISIDLPKSDKTFLSLTKAGAISLFTTGWTGVEFLTDDDRRVIAPFVAGCSSYV